MKVAVNRNCCRYHGLFVVISALAPFIACAESSSPVNNAGGAPALTVATFAEPPRSVRPLYRWWLPLAAVDMVELRREIDQMAQGGAGGMEIVPMPVPSPADHNIDFLRENGFGTTQWSHALEAIFTHAIETGMKCDMAVAASWPTSLPSVSRLNDTAAQQQLVCGASPVAPGGKWSGPLPLPEKAPPRFVTHLCAAAPAGETRLQVHAATGQSVGDLVTVGSGEGAEQITITAIEMTKTAPCAAQEMGSGGILTITPALAFAHPEASLVQDDAKLKPIAVLVARDTGATQGRAKKLDVASVRDITDAVDKNSQLSWTAPDGGDPWWLMAFYQTADGQLLKGLSATSPNYVIDHIGPAGAVAISDFYERSILTPKLRALLRRAGNSSIFEDSFEPSSNLKWTSDFLDEFARRRGYSLIPYLPALADGGVGGQRGSFDFDGVGERIREDYRQTWSELYGENHMKALGHWARTLGMGTRLQVEGGPMEIADLAALPDIPEGENRNFLNNPELWKVVGIGAQLRENEALFSNEGCPVQGGVWATTAGGKPYTVAQGTGASFARAGNNANLNWLYKAFAGGVNQQVWHGFPYLTSPAGTGERERWPGNTFGGNADFSEAFGPRMPQWEDYRLVNDHIARLQLVLRQGRPQYDVAVFWHDFGVKGIIFPYTGFPGLSTMFSTTSPLTGAGYTHTYLSPLYLDEASPSDVRKGVLWPDHVGFKAVVLYDQTVMPLASLSRIRDLAIKAGFPVVIVGKPPARAPGAAQAEADDAEIAAVVAELRRQAADPHGKVAFVENASELAASLARLGVAPSVERLSHPGTTDIMAVCRHSDSVDYYFLFNQGIQPVTQVVSLRGKGQPFELNTWTGEVRALGRFFQREDRVDVPLRIGANDMAVIAIGHVKGAPHGPSIHATDLNGPLVWVRGENLVLRATEAGLFPVRLSDNSTITASVEPLSKSIVLSEWSLVIESWTSDETGLPGLDHTRKTRLPSIAVQANQTGTLPSWTALGYGDASGLGYYETLAMLPSEWSGGAGAYLDLGIVVDTFRITVNGVLVPPASFQDTSHIDIGPYLHGGPNKIEVRVAVPLRNAVRAATKTKAPALATCGLIGPVVLIPYRDISLCK